MNLGLKITALSLVTIGFLYAGSDNEIASGTSGVSAQNVKKTNYLSRASCLLDGACFINYSLKAGEFQQIKDQLDQNMQDLSKLPVKVRYDRRFQVPNTDNGGGIYNFMNKMYQNPVALSGVYNVGTADAPVLKKWCAWVYKPTKNDPSFIEISDSFVRYSDDKRNGLYFLHENKDLADSTKASFPRKAYSAEFDSSLHTDKNAGAETFNVSVVKYQTPKAHINDTTFESIYPTYIDDGNADACPSHGSVFQPLPDQTSVTDISKFGNPTSGASRSDGLNPRIFLAEGIIDYLNKEIDDYAAYYTNAGLSASAIKSSASALTPSEYIKTLNGAYNARTANPSADREGEANVDKEAGKNEIKDYLKILYDLNEENDFGVANTAQVNSFKEIDGKRFAVENALRYYYNIGQLGENGKEIIPEKRPIFIKGYSNPTVLYDPNPDSDLNKCAKGLSLNDSHGWKILNSSCLFFNPKQAVLPPPPPPANPIEQNNVSAARMTNCTETESVSLAGWAHPTYSPSVGAENRTLISFLESLHRKGLIELNLFQRSGVYPYFSAVNEICWEYEGGSGEGGTYSDCATLNGSSRTPLSNSRGYQERYGFPSVLPDNQYVYNGFTYKSKNGHKLTIGGYVVAENTPQYFNIGYNTSAYLGSVTMYKGRAQHVKTTLLKCTQPPQLERANLIKYMDHIEITNYRHELYETMIFYSPRLEEQYNDTNRYTISYYSVIMTSSLEGVYKIQKPSNVERLAFGDLPYKLIGAAGWGTHMGVCVVAKENATGKRYIDCSHTLWFSAEYQPSYGSVVNVNYGTRGGYSVATGFAPFDVNTKTEFERKFGFAYTGNVFKIADIKGQLERCINATQSYCAQTEYVTSKGQFWNVPNLFGVLNVGSTHSEASRNLTDAVAKVLK